MIALSGLKCENESSETALQNALEKAVGRGTLLSLVMEKDGASEDVYFLNMASNRQVVEKIQDGELELPD